MISLSARVNIIKFTEVANGLPREDAERVAGAFPDLFRDAFVFGAEVPNIEPPPVAKSVPSTPAIDMVALKARCLAYVKAHPASKAEDVTAALHSPPDGHRDAFGKAVKKALESLVDDKALSCEGERRGRKYTAMLPLPQEEDEGPR